MKEISTKNIKEKKMIEVCKKCKREFDDDVHFIRCNEDDCPMRGENVLDMLLEQDDSTYIDISDGKEKTKWGR